MTQKNQSLLNYNLDFITTCQIDPSDAVKLVILTALVKHICEKKEDKYYFSIDSETPENSQLIDKWINFIHKIAPIRNITTFKKNTKKVFSTIRHLCKALDQQGIKLESKNIGIKVDGETKVKFVHLISGL